MASPHYGAPNGAAYHPPGQQQQPQYAQPQYAQPQYAQQQHAQPPYVQQQYVQQPPHQQHQQQQHAPQHYGYQQSPAPQHQAPYNVQSAHDQQQQAPPLVSPMVAVPQAGGAPYGGGGDAFAAGGMASAQLGLHLGTQMINVGQDYVQRNISTFIPYPMVKTYFNVTNTYVLNKLTIILFPYRHRSWQRAVFRDAAGNAVGFQPPRSDVNSVDLYIPTMATVTYVLLVGVTMGLRRTFHPEALGMTATGALIFIVCEVVVVKLGAYLLSLGNDVQLLDMLAIIGYNFVPLIVALLADLFLGRAAKYVAFAYCSISMGFFMLRSLRYSFLPDIQAVTASSPSSGVAPMSAHGRRTRVHFLFAVVAVQIVCSALLLV